MSEPEKLAPLYETRHRLCSHSPIRIPVKHDTAYVSTSIGPSTGHRHLLIRLVAYLRQLDRIRRQVGRRLSVVNRGGRAWKRVPTRRSPGKCLAAPDGIYIFE